MFLLHENVKKCAILSIGYGAILVSLRGKWPVARFVESDSLPVSWKVTRCPFRGKWPVAVSWKVTRCPFRGK